MTFPSERVPTQTPTIVWKYETQDQNDEESQKSETLRQKLCLD